MLPFKDSLFILFLLLIINTYQFIRPAAEADLLSMLQCMNSMKRFHSIYKSFIALCLVNQIHTGLIQCDRIGTCQNADIMDIRF